MPERTSQRWNRYLAPIVMLLGAVIVLISCIKADVTKLLFWVYIATGVILILIGYRTYKANPKPL